MATGGALNMVDYIRTIDDGAPQYDPRTHHAIRTWVDEKRTEGEGDDLVTFSARVAHYRIEPLPLTADRYAEAIQSHIDGTARSKGYADGFSIASYGASTVPAWAAEAQAFVAWRDAVWVYAYAQLSAVEAGTRPQPSISGLIAELPAITWPA